MDAPPDCGMTPQQLAPAPEKLAYALALAKRGYRVFPTKPDDPSLPPLERKAPAFSGWREAATTDPDIVSAWWSGFYKNHNVGVATGRGLLVIDCDAKNGKKGLKSLEELDMLGLPWGFRTQTPSGGIHVFLRADEAVDITVLSPSKDRPNGAILEYPGIDIRCEGGLVLGPGSTIHGVPYKELGGGDEPAPNWFLDVVRAARKPHRKAETREPLIELDSQDAIHRARVYLAEAAPEATEGCGGDHTTYAVAAAVREFGVSEAMCLELLLEHWNEQKAFPPWSPDDLEQKVENAYRYATGAWGGASALAEFDAVDIGQTPSGHAEFGPNQGSQGIEPKPRIFGEWITEFDPTQIPKRAWILGRFLAKGYLTGLVAPPGVGKTTIEIMCAVALAADRPDILGWDHCVRQRVFLWNQEDELDELKRRLAAVMKAFNVSWADITIDDRPALLLGSGADNSLMLAKRNATGAIVASKECNDLIEMFIRDDVGAAFFDPFVELHPADENSNVEVGAVGRVFRSIAVRAKCAVLLVHHTRKPPAGDSTGHHGNMDSARGGGALVGVTRMGATLYTIDDKTAAERGVPEAERLMYVRMDGGKNNMAALPGEPSFFKREGVNIGTFDDPEDVGVLRPVVLAKKQSRAKAARESFICDVEAVVNGGKMPVSEIARALISGDALYAKDKPNTLERKIKRLFETGENPTNLILTEENWRGKTKPVNVVSTVIGQSDKDYRTMSDIAKSKA